MDQDDLAGLHRRETLRATRYGPLRRLSFEDRNLPHWQDLGRIEEENNRLNPNGYWPKGMEESVKAQSMREFERAIFPIWKGIEEKDKIADAKLTPEQVAAQDVLLECLTLHKQDLAIHGSGIKPNRQGGDQEKMADLRRRASRAGQ